MQQSRADSRRRRRARDHVERRHSPAVRAADRRYDEIRTSGPQGLVGQAEAFDLRRFEPLDDDVAASDQAAKQVASARSCEVERAAKFVAVELLKERRTLVLMTRETPLSLIQIENMATVTRAGAIVMPASPGFYNAPTDVRQLVDFMVGKALDHLGVRHALLARWGEDGMTISGEPATGAA